MSLSFDRVARDYDRTRGGAERGRGAAGQIARHLVPGPVVEVGIGTGVVAAGLREHGHQVCGVDVSEPMARQARERLGGCVALGDAQALPFAAASVPNVVCAHVLHLLSNMTVAMAEAARVLRPGGHLVAVHGNLVADPDDVIETTAPLAPLQRRPDTPEGLAGAGTAAGLTVLSQLLLPMHERGFSPDEFADSIASKQWPYLWRIDDRTWTEVVSPVIAALRRLPDPGRPRHQVWRAHLSVLARP